MANSNDSRSGGADYLLRRPQLADADQLAELHVAVRRQAYAGMMSAKALADLDVGRFAVMWRRIAESVTDRERDGNITRIAQHVSTGAVAGFATVGAARDDDAPVPRQLWAINVLAAHHGTGVADRLLAETLGDEAAYLWVVEGNARAQSFYRRHRFVPDGGRLRDDDVGADEIRMIRP